MTETPMLRDRAPGDDRADGRDETLQDPRTVFQVLRRHYARYTPEVVADMCGISPAEFTYLADSITSNSGRERTTCFAYATGWTSNEQRTAELDTWLEHYNTARSHSALGGRPPASRLAA